ncbi:hypothetical protein HY630_01650 [Candidatus Uhrbacteria bacterium]|nr:hypothetical protein [Candidatus Uhrbacteria bacterium]
MAPGQHKEDQMSDTEMTGNARSEMGKPMYQAANGFRAVVEHAVELDGFPSQVRGPVLAVYCQDEDGDLLVEPRWLTPAGVGVHRGPMFRVQTLIGDLVHNEPDWFAHNEIDFARWLELALANAP